MKHLSNSLCPVVTSSLLALNILLNTCSQVHLMFILPTGYKTSLNTYLKEASHTVTVKDLSPLGCDTVSMGKVFLTSHRVFIFKDSLGLLCPKDANPVILQSDTNYVPCDTVSRARRLDGSSAPPLQETEISRNCSNVNFGFHLCYVGDRNVHSVWTISQ